MGKKVITMSLSEKSIQNAIQELRAYQNSLTYKCQLLAEKLAEKGVEIARVQIADLDAIFTSELISSVHVEYEGSTKGGGIWAVIAGTDHAAFVEFGTGTAKSLSWETAGGCFVAVRKWKNYTSDFRWKIWMVLSGRQWRLVVYRGNAKPTIYVSDRK